MYPRYKYAIAALVSVSMAACMVNGKFTSPQVAQTPSQYAQAGNASDTGTLLSWFQLYNDTVLQRFIKTTIDSNRNLLLAANRIEESREIAGIVKANLYPSFTYQVMAGGGQAGLSAQKTGAALDGGAIKSFGVLNWELDVWGRLRSANQAAFNLYLADIENRNALLISLIAEVANQYFLLRDLDNRLLIAKRTLVVRAESSNIINERFQKGYVSEIDKLQAEQQEAIAAASIPAFERQIIIVQNAIRTLMGLPPGELPRGTALFSQTISPNIPAGLPSQLLQRRPDIREAERNLEAQFNNIGVAKANLYPQLSLTGILGFASPQLSTFIGGSSFAANGFAGLVGPIFQFGQNKRRIRVEEFKTKQLFYAYEQKVLSAFADVDNALAQYRTYKEEHAIRIRQTAAARKALELITARYNYGYSSYYEVLIQENNLFDAELAESITYQQELNALVFLYKSLGGGW